MSNTLIVHEITKGDLRTPLMIVCMQGGKPLDWANGTKTAAFRMVTAKTNVSVVDSSSTGVTTHPTFSFTAVAATDRIVRNDHVVKKGDQIIVANSGGALPAGLVAATRYFAVNITPNYFQVSLVPNGTPENITDAGTGTNTFFIVGSIQKEFLAADVNTAGDYFGWFTCTESAEVDTFPNDGRTLCIRIRNAA